MKLCSVILAACLLAACSTVRTVGVDEDETIRLGARDAGPGCEEIPRIYSGASFVLCEVYAAPYELVEEREGKPAELFDLLFSAVADTLLLPWTIPQQIAKGNIQVE